MRYTVMNFALKYCDIAILKFRAVKAGDGIELVALEEEVPVQAADLANAAGRAAGNLAGHVKLVAEPAQGRPEEQIMSFAPSGSKEFLFSLAETALKLCEQRAQAALNEMDDAA